MSEIENGHGILDVINSITSSGESGRLEISFAGTHGHLLFNEGKLLDAKLGSLNGFQAVNAAVSMRNMQFSFVHSICMPQSGSIAPTERVVLSRFFGIETAEMEDPYSDPDTEVDWNMTPEQVVPLAEVDEIHQDDLLDTPTIEARPVVAPVLEEEAPIEAFTPANEIVEESSREATVVRRKRHRTWVANPHPFPFVRPRVALYLVLILAVTALAVALVLRRNAPTQVASVATSIESKSQPVSEASSAEVKAEPVSRAARPAKSTPIRSAASSPVLSTKQRDESSPRDLNAQDLAGQWKVINTVEKTGYKSYDKMQVGFRLKIKQTGNDFTATGEKFSENGRNLPANSRTPIRVRGSIDGDKIVATFIEDGQMRRTNGSFRWKLESGGGGLSGTFVSTAANTRGKSAATKEP